MAIKENIKALLRVVGMELNNFIRYPIYFFCMIMFPVCIILFFTSIMHENLPKNLPVGIVNLDNSTTSRNLIRKFDSFHTSKIVAYYPNVTEARRAMQRGEIYGFLYFPKAFSEKLVAGRQPTMSFYCNNSILLAGSLVYKEMRAVATMGGSGYNLSKMQKQGNTNRDIMVKLQPILTDVHAIDNPWLNYNAYLCSIILPASISLFIFLMTAYTIGTEIKFRRGKKWMRKSNENIMIGIMGKMFPHTCVFTTVMWFYQYWLYIHLGFPCNCPFSLVMLIGLILVLASQGFAIFIYGIMPSLRMSMSICALWAVLSFSISGFTFPVDAMDPSLRLLSWLFPMRSYYMIYQINIFHGYPIHYAWVYYIVLLVFMLLPIFVLKHLYKAMKEYQYIG